MKYEDAYAYLRYMINKLNKKNYLSNEEKNELVALSIIKEKLEELNQSERKSNF